MILLKRSTVANIEGSDPTPDEIRASLQLAIELEHATIPIYLYALYSIDVAKNPQIAAIIESVVLDEMGHLILASNVLNAIGGSPNLAEPGFVPTYPSQLPGSVDAGTVFHLAPFSMAQLDAFLEIEQPEDPLVFPVRRLAADPDAGITIGEFYGAISSAIATIGESLFVPGPRNQITPEIDSAAITVTDVATAQQAIATIIEQGEGTSTSPEEMVGPGFAHYYRFEQIAKGAQLVKLAPTPRGPGYAFTGEPIPFDPTGVYPVPTDPLATRYPPGSAARRVCDTFNDDYSALLAVLHDFFNGDATTSTFQTAVGLMMSLKSQAKAMMSGIPDPASVVGPSFELSDPANR